MLQICNLRTFTLDSQRHLQLNVETVDYKKSCTCTFTEFFSKLGFLVGFSIFIFNFPGRNSKAARGGAGARSTLFCLFMNLKRWVHSAHGRGHTRPYPLVYNYYLTVTPQGAYLHEVSFHVSSCQPLPSRYVWRREMLNRACTTYNVDKSRRLIKKFWLHLMRCVIAATRGLGVSSKNFESFILLHVRGTSKIKFKKEIKKRMVTVRSVIIFLNISRHPLLIWLHCCL